MKKVAVLILVVILGIIIWMINPFESNGGPSKKVHNKAHQLAEDEIYWKSVATSSHRQTLIYAITHKEGWDFEDEIIDWSNTSNFRFPFVLNRKWIFVHPTSSKRWVSSEKLLLYDRSRSIWLPLSSEKTTFKDREITESYREDLWSKNNDWAESFERDYKINTEDKFPK